MIYKRYIKRLFDLTGAVLLITILLPLLIPVAISIKIDSKGPIFFLQKRVGKGLGTIEVYKFRTMTDEERDVSRVIGKASGVTRVGYYLRRLKIDELPQLINVVRGEMSLVGPRPSIRQQLEFMSDEQKKRYSVRPGMTGLAQVCGNIHISWEKRYEYDLKYIRNISFVNDMRIILRTVLIIVKGEEKFVNQPLKIKKYT